MHSEKSRALSGREGCKQTSAFAYAYIPRMRGKADMRKIHESDISLTPTQERLLGYIAAQTTISGAAQATKKELSQLMGCSVKTIDRAITRMSREGLIKVEPCHSENGGQLSNTYSVVNS